MISNLILNIKNFQSYIDSGDINLDGRIILSGIDNNGLSNGTGKSTILKSLDLFLTEEYKDYTKADIKALTNANAKRGSYIDITVRCLIDGVPFEANLNGKDYFKLTADEYMLNKFKQELSGSIMNQGLVDNIADFEKRSELDNYIDKFYNTKEIVTKLKDLETITVTKINEALNKANTDYNNKVNKVNLLANEINSLKNNIAMYEQYNNIDIKTLNTAILSVKEQCKEFNKDYEFEKSKFSNAINRINAELNNNRNQIELVKQRYEYIRTQTQRTREVYLNKLNSYIEREVRNYNNSKLNDKPSELVSIEDLDKINRLVEGIEFSYGVTYKDIISQTRNNQNEIEKICNFVKPVTVLFVPSYQEPSNSYYVSYTEDFKFKVNIPADMKLDLNSITLDKVDTSYFDSQIKNIDVEALTKQLDEYKACYNNLLEEELKLTKLKGELRDYEFQLEGYNKLVGFKQQLETDEKELSIINTDAILAKQEVEKFEFRISELHKIIDSVCKFSGEELREEFGTKLAKISTILLEDIFNMKGTVSLESNGTKTSFKFNEGIGDLSFKSLSGGQLQKIKICINLAMLLFFYKDRQYIFLDEVFQHLDNPSKQRLIQYIVKELKIKNVLLIQHDTLKFEGFRDLVVYRGKDLNSVVKEVE